MTSTSKKRSIHEYFSKESKTKPNSSENSENNIENSCKVSYIILLFLKSQVGIEYEKNCIVFTVHE